MASILTAAQLTTAKTLCGFLSPPFPLNTAIAVCGNVAQECGFDPTLAGDGGASKYWMQWQGTRLTNYLSWCSDNKLDPTAPQAIQFFSYELPMPDGAPLIVPWLMDTSNNGQPTRSLATLTADICKFYERAGTPDTDNRIAYANQVAEYLNAVQPVPVPPPPTPTPKPVPVPIPMPVPIPVNSDHFAQFVSALGKLLGLWV